MFLKKHLGFRSPPCSFPVANETVKKAKYVKARILCKIVAGWAIILTRRCGNFALHMLPKQLALTVILFYRPNALIQSCLNDLKLGAVAQEVTLETAR
ncbi:hypothetical protein RB195_001318 [Necator americanus]|uniref:Uncharacterized protein n=1 Tax=Necator americanus TaxID=51031 RepID=A0ABR1DDS3_NECAM